MDAIFYLNMKTPLDKNFNKCIKRGYDISISVLVLIFIFPWVYLIIACSIKRKMPGKIFFKQKRVGLNGKEFMCYKFRTMKEKSNEGKPEGDEVRITPLGRYLRLSGLDELPQFWNVLLGDLSIVGPRPHMLAHDIEYAEMVDNYSSRHVVKPGITGWAQVNNLRGPVSSPEAIRKRVEYDFWYIQNWSFALDIKIMFYTFKILWEKL